MKKYNISTNLILVIKNLYDKGTGAVLFNGSIGDWFRTTVGVRQGCLLSPTLFIIFMERIMTDALEDHEGTVQIECVQTGLDSSFIVFRTAFQESKHSSVAGRQMLTNQRRPSIKVVLPTCTMSRQRIEVHF